ncbi:uncharacterized protein LOC116416548 isoform X2 [Nasonia vitripennis]|uniref:THAP-type domain-containing protein n=1 Tax=Nasonia vitripennis TaxID=7425 RepID=A0A7M7Q417_NASVI|nr:uncharacterized protein LOC116416548 isoform X2 [Nasonia vitripennis]
MFRATSDEIFRLWQKAIPNGNSLRKHHRICELHFKKDEVEKEFIHVLPDGSRYTLPKDKCSLKKGSVPSIFPLIEKETNAEDRQPVCCAVVSVEVNYLPKAIGACNASSTSPLLPSGSSNQEVEVFENNGNSRSYEITLDKTFKRQCLDETAIEPAKELTYSAEINFTPTIAGCCRQHGTLHDLAGTLRESEPPAANAQFQTICNDLIKNPQTIPLPATWIPQVISTGQPCIMWAEWKKQYSGIYKRIILFPDMSVKIYIEECLISIAQINKVEDVDDINELISFVAQAVFPCQKIDGIKAPTCPGYIVTKISAPGPKLSTCTDCTILRQNRKKTLTATDQIRKLREFRRRRTFQSRNYKRNKNRMIKKIADLKDKVQSLKSKCAMADGKAVQKACESLPEGQRTAVQACLNASKVKDKRGIRYTNQWIYECLLLRTKSRKTYNHLRNHNILALPSLQTLNRYMRVIKSSYGFDAKTLDVLKTKVESMDQSDVHGVLLVDEMKLSKSVSFNRQNLQMEGFTDLGIYTPEHQKGQKGDHALVNMFQPFKGKWVQALGCFLSKGSANGTVLHHMMEAIILAEKAGLKVDAIANDGASWNRTMWDLFGVTEDCVSIEHIVDPERRLWFFSDFPHLIKCVRNFFSKQEKHANVWTPDGHVSLKHWYALLAIENPNAYNLKVNYHLREEHINPQYYQKMNVALAFQFFGVADSMQIFQDKHPDLTDCEGYIKFCRRIKSLITAMNSRTPLNSLKPGNEIWQSIKSFLVYLKEWEVQAKSRNFEFITDSTFYGLKVSLKAALELCTFLVEKCDFKYVMTSRFNQDNLERFFGLMRNCCGSNDHPDSTLFIQMYILVSTYSLIKPPKGSNVSGAEIVDVLLSIKDIKNVDDRREQWDAQIDTILDKGVHADTLSDVVKLMEEHDYFQCSTSDYVLAYVAGFVVRKATRFAKYISSDGKPLVCKDCLTSLERSKNDEESDIYKLIRMRTKGFLKEPSIKLFNLISLLE